MEEGKAVTIIITSSQRSTQKSQIERRLWRLPLNHNSQGEMYVGMIRMSLLILYCQKRNGVKMNTQIVIHNLRIIMDHLHKILKKHLRHTNNVNSNLIEKTNQNLQAQITEEISTKTQEYSASVLVRQILVINPHKEWP